jgi:hypothetical protein
MAILVLKLAEVKSQHGRNPQPRMKMVCLGRSGKAETEVVFPWCREPVQESDRDTRRHS